MSSCRDIPHRRLGAGRALGPPWACVCIVHTYMGDSSSAWGIEAQESVKCLAICMFWICFSTLQTRSCTWAIAQQRTLHFPVSPWGDCLGDTDKHWPRVWDEHGDVLSPRAFTKGAYLHQGLSSSSAISSRQHQRDTEIKLSPSSPSLVVPEYLVFLRKPDGVPH